MKDGEPAYHTDWQTDLNKGRTEVCTAHHHDLAIELTMGMANIYGIFWQSVLCNLTDRLTSSFRCSSASVLSLSSRRWSRSEVTISTEEMSPASCSLTDLFSSSTTASWDWRRWTWDLKKGKRLSEKCEYRVYWVCTYVQVAECGHSLYKYYHWLTITHQAALLHATVASNTVDCNIAKPTQLLAIGASCGEDWQVCWLFLFSIWPFSLICMLSEVLDRWGAQHARWMWE